MRNAAIVKKLLADAEALETRAGKLRDMATLVKKGDISAVLGIALGGEDVGAWANAVPMRRKRRNGKGKGSFSAEHRKALSLAAQARAGRKKKKRNRAAPVEAEKKEPVAVS